MSLMSETPYQLQRRTDVLAAELLSDQPYPVRTEFAARLLNWLSHQKVRLAQGNDDAG